MIFIFPPPPSLDSSHLKRLPSAFAAHHPHLTGSFVQLLEFPNSMALGVGIYTEWRLSTEQVFIAGGIWDRAGNYNECMVNVRTYVREQHSLQDSSTVLCCRRKA